MKEKQTKINKREPYQPPQIKVLNLSVEVGFASSAENEGYDVDDSIYEML